VVSDGDSPLAVNPTTNFRRLVGLQALWEPCGHGDPADRYSRVATCSQIGSDTQSSVFQHGIRRRYPHRFSVALRR
jgi:hypothetical protein